MDLSELEESLKGKKVNVNNLTLEGLFITVENKALLHTLLDYQIEILSKLRNEDLEQVKKEVDSKFSARFKEFSTQLLAEINSK
ncbi:hypothetical protein OQZ33_07055 [Pedobacter sp. MC2016-05]|uniref:hypothetical protein n=1 Tax=Pedobacter sp. MC2016-05 TaxID=2994474 RepID=UPI0022460068|nr:hypothetical protein [Pedobacter sp. MC2016-05]MCX2474083.1 hypothetical protein [Pedobacter sp. MC2016-05]